MVSTASLLDAWHLRDVVENKLESSFVVSLDKVINRKPSPLCERQVAQTSEMTSLKLVQTSCAKDSNTICFLVNGG